MVRQISPSTSKTSSAPREGSDLGSWLTRELRVKGTPLPSQAPPSGPPGAGSGDEQSALAGWFTRDLIPKHSVRPLALPAVPPSQPPVRLEPFWSEVPLAELGPESDPPAWNPAPLPRATRLESTPLFASAARQASADTWPTSPASASADALLSYAPPPAELPALVGMPRASVALASSLAPTALAPLSLEEDDLLVLPGRRRSTGSGRAKMALALLLGLLLVGVILVVRIGQGPGRDLRAAANEAPPRDNGVLLPPPPASDDALLADPDVSEPARAARRASTDRAEPEGLLDPRDPSFARGGPNVRRYADVPSPTLSRLAREQRRLARERDEAARNAKAAKH